MSDAPSGTSRAIEVEGLVKQFKKGPLRGRRDRPPRRRGRDLRVPRPQRRRQVDDRPDADHAPADHRRARRASAASTSPPKGGLVREQIGAALQEAALDPHLSAREHMRLQTALHGVPKSERRGPRRRADRARRPRGGGRPARRRLLGRDAQAPRPRARAGPPAADPLPRRADHGPRPAEPQLALGGGRAARLRRGHDRLPDDPVPRGGRPARRPGRDHRPRPDRRRGNAPAAQVRDRRARRRGDPRGAGGSRPAGRGHVPLQRGRHPARVRRRGASRCASPRGTTALQGVLRELDAAGIELADLQLHQPTLDDVFLDKTGRKLEGAGEGPEPENLEPERQAVPA